MSTATICDYCDQRITDQTAGPDGAIRFQSRSDTGQGPELVTETIDFHHRCLEAMRAGGHRTALGGADYPDWAPATVYTEGDLRKFPDGGVRMALRAHRSNLEVSMDLLRPQGEERWARIP